MKDFSEPEIQQKPADGLLLQMKAMNIDKVVNFPFPSPPDKVQLRGAEERLQLLRLLSCPAPGLPLREVEKIKFTSTVTPLGKAVASFPVSPRFGKILALSHQHNLLPLSVALVSLLSVQVSTLLFSNPFFIFNFQAFINKTFLCVEGWVNKKLDINWYFLILYALNPEDGSISGSLSDLSIIIP